MEDKDLEALRLTSDALCRLLRKSFGPRGDIRCCSCSTLLKAPVYSMQRPKGNAGFQWRSEAGVRALNGESNAKGWFVTANVAAAQVLTSCW